MKVDKVKGVQGKIRQTLKAMRDRLPAVDATPVSKGNDGSGPSAQVQGEDELHNAISAKFWSG